MQSTAITVNDYIASLPDDRQIAIKKLRKILKDNLPKGFEECMSYGMIGYVVPHSIYPKGYHCDPKLPLPFINVGSKKNFISMHHMGLYGDINLLDWFVKKYAEEVPSKLDMGKGCVRFKKVENIPFELIGELAKKVTVDQYIKVIEKAISKK
jgi:uncharacterized protein YdhG (YjbR/CyaY superfamily)